MISFSIFIASTTQIDLAGLDFVAFGHLDRQHRPLHRRDDRVTRGAVVSLLRIAVAPPAGELGVRRLRHEELDLEAPALDLGLDDPLSHPCRPMRPIRLVVR